MTTRTTEIPTADATNLDRPMVELRGVTKRFGAVTAVDNVSLQVASGEFITLLGPSGCGKTTILRMIAGFETPTDGIVLLDGQDVTFTPPYRRNVNQVFQSYALFPHLSVRDNIGFGLRMKKVGRVEADQRIAQTIEMVSLTGLEHRRPSQLSGGQKQRVALARAIVCQPRVLLLDEPLAALDAKLRRAMQVELKRLRQRLGITFIFVTHDQEEALTMSDRIAVINHGRIEQLGGAWDIYHAPRTSFVANFIGHANILEAALLDHTDQHTHARLNDEIDLTIDSADVPAGATRTLISIRPEKVRIEKTRPAGSNVFEAKIEEELFKGAIDQLLLRTAGGLELTAIVANESAAEESFHQGENVFCQIHPDDVVVIQG